MNRIGEIFVHNLRELRKSAKLTQDALAKRAKVETQTITNYENKRRWPDAGRIDQIAGALKVPVTRLFLDPDDPDAPFADLLEKLRKLDKAKLAALDVVVDTFVDTSKGSIKSGVGKSSPKTGRRKR